MKHPSDLTKSERKKAETVAYLQGYMLGLAAALALKAPSRKDFAYLSANSLSQIEATPPTTLPGILFLPYSCAFGYKEAITYCCANPRSRWAKKFEQTSSLLEDALAQNS